MTMKKSPRSPSIALDEAIEKAKSIYEKERFHAAPIDVIAQNIGYKSSNNGTFLPIIASLGYFGLLDRPKPGHLAVSPDVEAFLYAPTAEIKRALLLKWLKTPAAFLAIIEKYADRLPSDATLKYDLIAQGFSPPSAESLIIVFKKSAEFAGLYDEPHTKPDKSPDPAHFLPIEKINVRTDDASTPPKIPSILSATAPVASDSSNHDKIPIRLPKGRKAWLVIPSPFYEQDKERLRAQIDLLLADDEN
jgi:hypothetical protein